MINFAKPTGTKVLELGGGANRHPLSDVNVDIRKVDGVDFTVDFNKEEWPEIGSDGFEIVYSCFTLEHVSWRQIPNYLKQVYRILKPGGRIIFVTPNTEAQIKWVLEHGWEKRQKHDGDFIEASRILYGDLDYAENSHRAFLSPSIVTKLLFDAGFENILTQPFGEIKTDMVIEATKPIKPDGIIVTPGDNYLKDVKNDGDSWKIIDAIQFSNKKKADTLIKAMNEKAPAIITQAQANAADNPPRQSLESVDSPKPAIVPPISPDAAINAPSTIKTEVKTPADIYDRNYFNNYQNGGWIWDYPTNQTIAQKILDKKPESVLELGCGRGYVIKRLQDNGIRVQGIDVSKHAWMTRACDPVISHDFYSTPWPIGKQEFDLCFSYMLLEHISESNIEEFCGELSRVSKRGLHAITFKDCENNQDGTRCNLKTKEWWQRVLPENHLVADAREMNTGELTSEYIKGDGRIKLNLGSAWTMFHHGWTNIDEIDAGHFAQIFAYNYMRHDVKQGLPYSTGVVDLIFSSHMLEHLTYEEGIRFLKDCRRVIRPTGAMRLLVPDANELIHGYVCGKAHNENNYIGSMHNAIEREGLAAFDHINDGCAKTSNMATKLWAVLGEGHKAFYDIDTLTSILKESGWLPVHSSFRQTTITPINQILRETVEMSYGGLSLFIDAVPAMGCHKI